MLRPFDSDRISALLEGLEASILRRNDLENLQTIGSEYYSPRYVLLQDKLRSSALPLKALSEVCSLITDGDHGVADYQKAGIPFILSENVKEGWIDTSRLRFISRAHHQTLPRSSLRPGDVLVTKTGVYFGKSAVVDASLGEANTIAHVGLLRPRSLINSVYLSTYLNCSYGQAQLRRRGIKATRPEIKLVEFQDIEVPLASGDFQSRIETKWRQSQEVRTAINASARLAEATLLEALGLADWTSPDPLSYTATLSDFIDSKRLDAQFHRPKYRELQAIYEERFKLFSLTGSVLKGRTVPYSNDGDVPIIRSGDLSDIDDESSFLKASSTEPIFYLERRDVVISSIGFGSIGKVQVFDKDGRFGTVSEVTVVRQSDLNPYYLAAYLRSELGQLQIDRYITGATGQLHLYPKDVEKFFVPVLADEVQEQFERLHAHSLTSKKRSRALLDAAKRAVEIAIEDGEDAALTFLDDAEGAE